MARMTTAGVGDMVAGKLQEIKGRLTGRRADVVKGKARQAKGYARYKGTQATGRVQDALDRETR